MTFTNDKPTSPGFFVWRRGPDDDYPGAAVVFHFIGTLRVQLSGLPDTMRVAEMGGQWCRLVPAEEIEKAFHEGVEAWGTADATSDLWDNSRSKRVMEGKE